MGPIPAGLKDTVFLHVDHLLFPLCHGIRGPTALEDTSRQTHWDRKMGWGEQPTTRAGFSVSSNSTQRWNAHLEMMRKIVPVIYISSVKSKRKEARQSLKWEENWRVLSFYVTVPDNEEHLSNPSQGQKRNYGSSFHCGISAHLVIS